LFVCVTMTPYSCAWCSRLPSMQCVLEQRGVLEQLKTGLQRSAKVKHAPLKQVDNVMS
jgi:hypothetical protein